MKIAYVTNFDARQVEHFSGTPYFMSGALARHHQVDFIGPLKRRISRVNKLRRSWVKRRGGGSEHTRFYPEALASYARQVEARLAVEPADIVLSPLWAPVAALSSRQPLYVWTDISLCCLEGELFQREELSARGWRQLNDVTQAVLDRSERVFLGSEWARQRTLARHNTDPDRIGVLPLGANLQELPARESVTAAIRNRSLDVIRLVLVGTRWENKGVPEAIEVTRVLRARGLDAQLVVVGCEPPGSERVPDFVHIAGFISKHTLEGRRRLEALMAGSHFFILPTRVDGFGIAFCEAKAFGLPGLGPRVGAVPEIVADGVDGQTFDPDQPAEAWAAYVLDALSDPEVYRQQAMAALDRFWARFNWDALARQFIDQVSPGGQSPPPVQG